MSSRCAGTVRPATLFLNVRKSDTSQRLTCLGRPYMGWLCVGVADKELPAPEEVVSAQIGAPHYVGDVRNRSPLRNRLTVVV